MKPCLRYCTLALPALLAAALTVAAQSIARPSVASPSATSPSVAPPLAAPPVIEARNWVLVDFGSGQSLAESNADQRVEPASLTKLMSAYVIFGALRDGRLKMSATTCT